MNFCKKAKNAATSRSTPHESFRPPFSKLLCAIGVKEKYGIDFLT
jgi:hypothetical protein